MKSLAALATKPSQRTDLAFAVAGLLSICAICACSLLGQHEIFWWNQQRLVLQTIKDNQYPDAAFVEERAVVAWGTPGEDCWVIGYVTYQTDARLREVRQWYTDHPQGISYFDDGRGLDRVYRDPVTRANTYRVMHRKQIDTLVCPER